MTDEQIVRFAAIKVKLKALKDDNIILTQDKVALTKEVADLKTKSK